MRFVTVPIKCAWNEFYFVSKLLKAIKQSETETEN